MTPSPPSPILPGRLTPFIGRQNELQRMLEIFGDPSVRLVTILGAGGIGKTRFGLEAASLLADRFQHGVVFIPLASISAGDELLPALAKTLGVQIPPGGGLQQAILEHLSGRQALLFLDNFEHLLEQSVIILEILTAAPGVKILATSREKLGLEAETLFHLEGLALPPAESSPNAEEYDALRLFLQKARQARPGFALDGENTQAAARVCRMVDGNPLGILLAAAWVEHFSPAEVLAQMSHHLDFLARRWRDMEPRHASMRAVLDSSYQRLTAEEKAVFRKLAIFRGGFDLAAAEAVAGADLNTLIALVEKSLLSRDPGAARYDLHELLRQYAGEELQAHDELRLTSLSHAHFYLDFLTERGPRLISPGQATALNEIQADLDNIRQACSTVIGSRDFASARRFIPILYGFCDMRSRFYEGSAIFWQAIQGLAPQASETPQTAWVLALLSWYDLRFYDPHADILEKIASYARECLVQTQSSNDLQGIAASHVLLGAVAGDGGDGETAIREFTEALQIYPALDDFYWVNMRIGICRQAARQYPQAVRAFQTSLKRGKETGDRVKTGWSLVNIGDTLLMQKRASEAESYLEESCALFQEIGARFAQLWATFSTSRAALELGKNVRAREYAEKAAQLARELHSAPWIAKTDNLLRQIGPDNPLPSPKPTGGDRPDFSPRELEVLRLLKSEMSGPEIARNLFISNNTLHYHTKNIYQKLGVNSRLEAIQRLKELGL